MKVLVTGANGYLGQGIVKSLLEMNETVIATDIKIQDVDERAIGIEGDIFEIDDPFEYFDRPDIVLHLAWRNGFEHSSDTHFVDLPKHNLFLKRLIDAGIKRVCVMGSMHEVGFYEGSIHASTPCNPMNQYGIAKNALRQSIELYAKACGAEFIWLRGYYIVSSAVNGSSIFSKIVRAAQEGKRKFPFTMGQNQYDFLNYDEFCYQVALSVVQKEELGIINICSGKPEKLCDRVEQFIKENQLDIVLDYGAFPDRPYDSKAVWGDDTVIRRILENHKMYLENKVE